MIIVKLGGSVITDKARARTFRGAVVSRLAKELSATREPLILVHGAGSFGHHEAKRHELHKGYVRKAQLEALPRVYRDLRELDLLVLDRLIAAGLKPVSIPPYSIAKRGPSGTVSMDFGPFRASLELGLMPVSFGDVIRDDRTVFSILSGDSIVERLAARFKPRKAIFVTDVDGIYDRPPGSPGAALIVEASAKVLLTGGRIEGSTNTDVTRGMAGKAVEMARIARLGTIVNVVNGNKAGRLKAAILGRDTLATEIHR